MKILELNQLEKKFGENKVLKGINLVANRGDVEVLLEVLVQEKVLCFAV